MAETQKRKKDEKAHGGSAGAELDRSKRQKPYKNIISLLDDEVEELDLEVEPSNDFMAILAALQQELSPPPPPAKNDLAVMRHILEASDDELGIPNRSSTTDNNNNNNNVLINSGDGFNDDGLLWEFEDEAANFYAVLQSQLFM